MGDAVAGHTLHCVKREKTTSEEKPVNRALQLIPGVLPGPSQSHLLRPLLVGDEDIFEILFCVLVFELPFSSTSGSGCPSYLSSEGPGVLLVRVTCPHRLADVAYWTHGMQKNTRPQPGH